MEKRRNGGTGTTYWLSLAIFRRAAESLLDSFRLRRSLPLFSFAELLLLYSCLLRPEVVFSPSLSCLREGE